MNWAENIKRLRDKMLITQNELADLVRVSIASINRYENGKFVPTMNVKRKLKDLFKEHGIVREDE